MLGDIEQLDLYEDAQTKIKKVSEQYKKRKEFSNEEVYEIYETIDEDVAINYHDMMRQETAAEYDNTIFFILAYIQLKYLYYLDTRHFFKLSYGNLISTGMVVWNKHPAGEPLSLLRSIIDLFVLGMSQMELYESLFHISRQWNSHMNAYSHDLDMYILLLKIRLGHLMKAPALDSQSLDGVTSWIEKGKASWNFFIDCMTMIGQIQHCMMIFKYIEKLDSTEITITTLSKKNLKYSLEDTVEKLKNYITTRFKSNIVEMKREALKEYFSEYFMALGEPFRYSLSFSVIDLFTLSLSERSIIDIVWIIKV